MTLKQVLPSFSRTQLTTSIATLALLASGSFAQPVRQPAPRALQFQREKALTIAPVGVGAAAFNQQQPRPAAMVSADFDADGVKDLAVGYGLNKGGVIAIFRGKLDAIAPQSKWSWLDAGLGRYSDAFLPQANMIPVPVEPNLLIAADVNGDGYIDLVFAANNGHALYVLGGNGKGQFTLQQPVTVQGAITALAAYRPGGNNAADALVVGVKTAKGNAAELYRMERGGFALRAAYAMPGAVTAIATANLDSDLTPDAALLAGGQVVVLHGAGALMGTARIETLPVSDAVSLTTGSFLFDRHAGLQLAVLTSDGSVHFLAHQGFDPRAFTTQEITAARRNAMRRETGPTLAQIAGNTGNAPWTEVETLGGVAPAGFADTAPVLLRARAAGSGQDDVLAVNGAQQEIAVVSHPASANSGMVANSGVVAHSPLNSGDVVAAIAQRVSPLGPEGIITLTKGSPRPNILSPAQSNTLYVNTTTDSLDANDTARCTQGSGETCSLRDAITYANQDAALNIAGGTSDTIMIPAGTYNLTYEAGQVDANNNAVTHLEILGPMTLVGDTSGAGVTINAQSNDTVFTINPGPYGSYNPSGNSYVFDTTFENLTITGGQNTNNPANSATGLPNNVGGAINWDADGTGNLTLTNCNVNSNTNGWGDGGGIWFFNSAGSGTGTLTVTGGSVSKNSTSEQGGGVYQADSPAGFTATNVTFADNTGSPNVNTNDPGGASGADYGGGLLFTAIPSGSGIPQSAIIGGSITGNSADGDGGGIYTTQGISITGGVVISGNSVTGSGGGIFHNADATTTVTGANITSNSAVNTGGGITVGTETAANGNAITISNSRIFGNTSANGTSGLSDGEPGSTGAGQVTATENWWGCNAGPMTPADGCDQAAIYDSTSGSLSATPNIVLTLGLMPTAPGYDTPLQATADVNTDSNSSPVSGGPGALEGLSVAFDLTVSGTPNSASANIDSTGAAPATFPASDLLSPGASSASATLDNQTVTSNFTLLGPPTVTSINPILGPSTGGTTVNITGTNFAPGDTVKFGASGSLSPNTITATTITVTSPAGTGTVDVTVTDAYGNTSATGPQDQFIYGQPPAITSANSAAFTAGKAGVFTVTATGTPPPVLRETGSLPSGVTFADNGNGTASISGTATVAGSYPITITAGNGSLPNATQSFTLEVDPGPATHFAIPSGPAPFFTVFDFNIYADDAYGNLATSYNGTVALTSSDPGFVNLGPFTLSNGQVVADGGLRTAGVDTITATDVVNPSITGTGSFTVQPGAATHFGVVAPASTYAGSLIGVTLTAYDLYGNVATGYGATVHFTSTDPSAVLPADATLTNGSGTFSATLMTVGSQTITATDTAVSSITGTTGAISVTIPNFVVENTNDSGTGSLRAALANAASAGSGNITFDPAGFASAQTITLTSGTLNIPSNTTITGPTTGSGSTLTNLVTVSGNNAATVFTVASGVTGASIANLNIANGVGYSNGGGITNAGTLTVSGCTFSNNSGNGGGISNAGTMTVSACTLSNNSGYDTPGGGGITNTGTLTVIGSTLSNNSSYGFSGGGISSTGTLAVTDSTISNNSTLNYGGGIFINSGTVTVTGSTVSNNHASYGNGGGIFMFSGNLALANTIVSGNGSGNQDDLGYIGGSVSGCNGGYQCNAGGNIVGYYNRVPVTGSAHPNLAPLGNYGGPTQTMIPLPGSPAICAGLAGNILSGVTTDQRGESNTNTTYPGYNSTTPCVDSGAVQTNYLLTFSTDPPARVIAATNFSAAVTLDESGSPFIVTATPLPTVTIPLMLNGTGTLTGGSTAINDATGIATYSGLQVDQVGNDTLTANLTLNPNVTPTALSISATSSSFNVGHAATTTTESNATATYSAAPQSLTLSATVTSNAGTVNAGTVTFTVLQGTIPIGSAVTSGPVTNGSAAASYTLPGGTAGGTYTIQAVYSGTASFATSSDNTHTLTIDSASTTTSASNASTTFNVAAQSVTLAATVTSPSGTVNEGTATFTVLQGGTPVGTAATSATVRNGSASVTYTLPAGTAAGSYTIQAVYGGTASLQTSTDSTHTLTVNKAATTTSASNATATFNVAAQNVPLSALVTSLSGAVNAGTVTFTVLQGGTPVGTAMTSAAVSNGSASVNYTLPAGTAAGAYTIQAVYSGTVSLIASSDNTHTLTIGKATATVTLSNLTQTYTGSPLPVTATTAPPGLTVNVTYNGSANPPTTVGSYPVVATVQNSNYTGSATGTLKITQATPSVMWNAPAAITYGTALSATQLDATASVAGAFVYTPAAGTVLSVGLHTLSVSFTPTVTTDYSTPNPVTTMIVVNVAPLDVTANNATKVYGTANPAFTGSVTGMKSNDSFTESFTTAATTSSNVGNYPIVPSVAGADLTDYTQVVTDGTLSITQAASSISLIASATTVTPGQPLTLNATVTSATTGTPTGTVTFFDNIIPLGKVQLNTGVASFMTSALAPGITHKISATYSGDLNFTSSSTTAGLIVTVAPLEFTLTINGNTLESIYPGGTVTYSFGVAPEYGSYAGPMSFAISGLPSGITATFSPNSIPANGGPQTVTLTISDAALASAASPPTGLPKPFMPIALGLLLLPLAGARRMRRNGRRMRQMLYVMVLACSALSAALLSGCGSANGFFSQAAKDYSLTITAATGAIQKSATVTLNVQ